MSRAGGHETQKNGYETRAARVKDREQNADVICVV